MEWTCRTRAIFYKVCFLSPLTALDLGRHSSAFPLWVAVLAEDATMRKEELGLAKWKSGGSHLPNAHFAPNNSISANSHNSTK